MKLFKAIILIQMFAFGSLAFGKNECLPEGEHRDLIVANCTSCHTAKLVCQNRMTRARWDETLTWMQKEQNLWPLGDRRKPILDYLEKHLGIKQVSGNFYKYNYPPNPIW